MRKLLQGWGETRNRISGNVVNIDWKNDFISGCLIYEKCTSRKVI